MERFFIGFSKNFLETTGNWGIFPVFHEGKKRALSPLNFGQGGGGPLNSKRDTFQM